MSPATSSNSQGRRPARARRAVENIDIARIFEEIADLLDIQGEHWVLQPSGTTLRC